MIKQFFNTVIEKSQTFKFGILASAALVLASSLTAIASESPLADGTYLFGQSPQPEQINKEYLVFEVRDGNVSGAAYYPASEFSCFTGTINSQRLDLAMIDPYDSSAVYPYTIAVETETTVSSAGDRLSTIARLQGFHPIAPLSDNDNRILAICQGN